MNQVQKLHAPAQVALGDADHQAQVGLGQALFGGLVPVGDAHGQVHFLVGGEQGHTANLFQIDLHRVVDGHAVGAHAGLQLDALGLGQLLVVDGDVVEVLHNLHALGLQGVVEFLNLLGVEVQLAQGVQDFLGGELALALAQLQKVFDHGFLIGLCRHILYHSFLASSWNFPFTSGFSVLAGSAANLPLWRLLSFPGRRSRPPPG